MNDWFTIDQIDNETYIISEYRHWEETHCYLLNGAERSLLIDKGLGICDIHEQIIKLTARPIVAAANSLGRVSALPVKQVFPAHHTLNIEPEILL